MKYVCEWCGKVFESYPSRKRKFCGTECSYEHKSKKYNPQGYQKKPHLTELNKQLNPSRMTEDLKGKLSLMHMGEGEKKSYPKIKGRHLHRVIAEMIIGRPLNKHEVVHHIDGNKRNNDPSNLKVFTTQNEHASYHNVKGRFISGKAEL